jgi:uncharacterized protein YjiS (DUF1127 family)
MTFDPATTSYLNIERQARALQGREMARLTRLAVRGLGRAIGACGMAIARRRVIEELNQLDDHMLEDIGLARHEIEYRVMTADRTPTRDVVAESVTTAPVPPVAANDVVIRPARVA